MKTVLLTLSLFLLGGCISTTKPELVKTKIQVLTPDSRLYDCPMFGEFPNHKTLTDIEISRIIVELYKNNVRCYNSSESIRKFLEDSKKKMESNL